MLSCRYHSNNKAGAAMDQYSRTALHLQSFEATGNLEDRVERANDGSDIVVQTIVGNLVEQAPTCRNCNHITHVSDNRKRILKHLGFSFLRIDVEVHYRIYRCPECGRIHRNGIPFKAKGHNMTWLFQKDITDALDRDCSTISNIANMKGTNKNIVRMLDRERLEALYGEMRPETRPVFIGIDEFSLHRNHRYATVVVDLCTGHVIFLEEGNSKAQAEHFIRRMGPDVMRGVVGVSMDMNAQFSSVFEQLCPWVRIVYDPFHIIRHYNDNVLTEIRRSEQRRLQEGMERARKEKDNVLLKELNLSYSLLKRSNFLILANRSTLKARDEAARAHNRMLFETYERRGLSLPDGERKWRMCGERRLEEILASNERIQAAYVFREMLQSAIACKDPRVMRQSLLKFISVIKASGIPELEKVWRMLEKRMDGIVTHARFHISNGPVEGTNNMIKTLRRQAYGYRDTRYFFLKIWERSRKHTKSRDYSSPQKCA